MPKIKANNAINKILSNLKVSADELLTNGVALNEKMANTIGENMKGLSSKMEGTASKSATKVLEEQMLNNKRALRTFNTNAQTDSRMIGHSSVDKKMAKQMFQYDLDTANAAFERTGLQSKISNTFIRTNNYFNGEGLSSSVKNTRRITAGSGVAGTVGLGIGAKYLLGGKKDQTPNNYYNYSDGSEE